MAKYDNTTLLTKEIKIPGLEPLIYSTRQADINNPGQRTVTVSYDQNGNIDFVLTSLSRKGTIRPHNKNISIRFEFEKQIKKIVLKHKNLTDGCPLCQF